MPEEKEPKTQAVEIPVKFTETEAAWLKTEAGTRGVPVNVVIRQCVAKAMEAQIEAELAPLRPAAPAGQVGAAAQAVAPRTVNPQNKIGEFIDSPEIVAFYSWCTNNLHHVGAAELANILYKYVRGESIDAKVPQPVTNFKPAN